jgi:hypothetical protein
MYWPLLTRKDITGILAAIALLALFVFVALVGHATLGQQTNWGFGPEWECTYPGKGDPVCIKRVPAKDDRAVTIVRAAKPN